MISLIVGMLAGAVILLALKVKFNARWTITIFLTGFGALMIIGLGLQLLEGLYKGYSEGVIDGYVVNLTIIEHKGIIWKTREGKMQLSAAIQEKPFTFTVTDNEIFKTLSVSIGKRVRLHYIQWMIMPARIGDSGYEIVKIEVLE